ncbi:transcription-repair coupling factor [bacterium]|nr:transcription-repair coupling factor [bacterium]
MNIESQLTPQIIYNLLKTDQKIAIITPNNEVSEELQEQVKVFTSFLKLDKTPVTLLDDSVLDGVNLFDEEIFRNELAIVGNFQNGNILPIITASKLHRFIISPKSVSNKKISTNEKISINILIDNLIDFGYKQQSPVEERGFFEVKGGIVDIFSPLNENPIRVEFFGNIVDSIREFDVESGSSLKNIENTTIYPITSFDFNINSKEKKDIFLKELYDAGVITFESVEYIHEKFEQQIIDNETIFCHPLLIKSPTTPYRFLKEKNFSFYLYDSSKVEEIFEKNSENRVFNLFNSVDMVDFNNKILSFDNIFKISPLIIDENKTILSSHLDEPIRIVIQEAKTVERTFKIIDSYLLKGDKIIFFYQSEKRKNQFEKLLKKFSEFFNDSNISSLKQKNRDVLTFFNGTLKQHFFQDNTLFISDITVFGSYTPAIYSQNRKKNLITSFSDLQIGDYVIHRNYGVGQYKGMITKEINGAETDFLEIHYQGSDRLFVPVYHLHLLYKHSSFGNSEVKLDSFKSKSWQQKKITLKKSIQKVAQELVELYALRSKAKGWSFASSDEDIQNFCDEFPFTMTADQEEAWSEINRDMERVQPMDRLVCGDVGFGKTEVAMRAAYKAVLDNKQVAILTPTTVLAYQHYHTFMERFKNVAVNIEYLNSFKTGEERKRIVNETNRRKVDILIGTHALLSEKLTFPALGLLIIDEEQKFGVKDKEKLRELRKNVDTITLTATPIPRTLNFSLAGIRDLSLIATPPKDRKPVKTVVAKKRKELIIDAIQYERKRGGQIFYVHNRVETLFEEADFIYSLFPDIKLAVAHAQMNKPKLEKIIYDFYIGKFEILVSTNLIESGIDIPNANTMIIDRADTFGLSSLYQLRGRVGRSSRQGFALLLLPERGKINPIAERRLSVISRYTDLGSGFQIAMQDMEIRGAGTLLGFAQKGHIEEIGYEAYMSFLQEALEEIKSGNIEKKPFQGEIHTTFVCKIPTSYIKDENLRVSFYKKISNISDDIELISFKDELIDRFGKIPIEIDNLFNLITIKRVIAKYFIEKIVIQKDFLHFKFSDSSIVSLSKLVKYHSDNPNFNINQQYEVTLSKNFDSLLSSLDSLNHILSSILK